MHSQASGPVGQRFTKTEFERGSPGQDSLLESGETLSCISV